VPLLGKTGARSPWLPGPLQGSIERVQPALVVMAIVPSVLLGSITQPIGRLSRPEDTAWPARPAIVVQQPAPVPSASVAQTYAPRDQPVVQPDHTWPLVPIVGQQPRPIASFWAPQPARLPNTDPLRPPLLIADPPDSTLAQPSALLIGRLPRAEDTSRPARPAIVQTGATPFPSAQARLVGVVHDGDRLPVGARIVSGQQPTQEAVARSVGWVRAATPLVVERVPAAGIMLVSARSTPHTASVHGMAVPPRAGDVFASVFVPGRTRGPGGGGSAVRSEPSGGRVGAGGPGDVQGPGASGNVEGD